MSWYTKERSTHFDTTPIEGLFFLDGDAVARALQQHWTEGQKYPMIAFPSGLEFSIWETSHPQHHQVHLFGEMDLHLESTRDAALHHATHIAQQLGYLVKPVGTAQLEVAGYEPEDHLRLTYDNAEPRLTDVERILAPLTERSQHPAHNLMPDELRQQLPPLLSGEKFGLQAPALVKYFLPDSGWTWYASEFDGEDIFFGLVAGWEVELGSFSLAELQALRGALNLPVERDLHFQPTPLDVLLRQHRQSRR